MPLWPNLDDLSFSISIFGLLPKSLKHLSCLCTICSLHNSQSSLCLSGHVSLLVATLCWVSPHLDYNPYSWLWPVCTHDYGLYVKLYVLIISISLSPFWLTHCALAIGTPLLVLEQPRSFLIRTFACVSFTGTLFLDLSWTGILLTLYVLAVMPSPWRCFSGYSSWNPLPFTFDPIILLYFQCFWNQILSFFKIYVCLLTISSHETIASLTIGCLVHCCLPRTVHMVVFNRYLVIK